MHSADVSAGAPVSIHTLWLPLKVVYMHCEHDVMNVHGASISQDLTM